MFDERDYQLLRTAAFDIQGNEQNFVRVANIARRIKNWWKAKFNPEFAQQQDELEDTYEDLEGPLSDLISALQSLDKAFKSQDPDSVARISAQLPVTITSVTDKMQKFRRKVRDIDALIPVSYIDENGHRLSKRDLEWTTKGYDANQELMKALWDRLPQEFKDQIPIRTNVEMPITSIPWFRKYSPNNIRVSGTVRRILAVNLAKIFAQFFPVEKAREIVANGLDPFIENLKHAILNNSIFIYADFPEISDQVTHRPSNEMMIRVYCPQVSFPLGDGEILISVGKIELTDMSVSVTGDRRSNDLRLGKADMIEPTAESTQRLIEYATSLNPPEPLIEPDQEPKPDLEVDESKVNDFGIFAQGPVSKIVRRAVLSKTLPKTDVVVSVSGHTLHHKLRFAKVLSSALRQEIEAESSVRHAGEDVQVQASVLGSRIASVSAVDGISRHLADSFVKHFKVGIDTDVRPGKSSLALAESKALDESFRKVAFDYWR